MALNKTATIRESNGLKLKNYCYSITNESQLDSGGDESAG